MNVSRAQFEERIGVRKFVDSPDGCCNLRCAPLANRRRSVGLELGLDCRVGHGVLTGARGVIYVSLVPSSVPGDDGDVRFILPEVILRSHMNPRAQRDDIRRYGTGIGVLSKPGGTVQERHGGGMIEAEF